MNRISLWLLLCLCFIADGLAQAPEVPQDYFSNPMEIPLILSGSFGELRSNHFHSGLDIKTQQREGIPVYAPADGFVSRIKVAHYGYGKALYIKHTNGYSTVYAHLSNYAGDIQDYVKGQQYKKESYVIELFPEAEMLPVKKGDLIAYSGNSGSSGGPHLHFEIRDGNSRPMNPMLFGVDIPDGKKPLVNSVIAYPQSSEAHINNAFKPVKLRLIPQKDGSFKTEKVKAIGQIGFGISAYDQMDGASNKNGVYEIKTSYNGETKLEVLFDRFSFNETRYLNQYIDYGYWQRNKSRVQRLFVAPNNPLSLFKNQDASGLIEVEEGFQGVYSITVKDFQDNTVRIDIPIEGATTTSTPKAEDTDGLNFVSSAENTSITKGKFSVFIPSNSLYEDVYLDINAEADTLDFHYDEVPIHKNITISFDASNYSEKDLSKLFIGRLNYKGEPYYNTTYRKGKKLSIRTRTFGTYALASDLEAPTISPENFQDQKWISNNKTLKIKIEDEGSGIKSYRATLNGKFILMEYNYKKDVLTYDFGDNISTDTENNLKLVVVDNVGNSTTFEATFFRKQS
ncbi:peptidoglycan DD-metalloendopeptidase family protein [Gilvibacter sp.]|uniref:M23 family metallopeptidase n=1 Tax=Gilvibacter sp. TaxID=2729997 RepID=UPI003F49D593